MAGAIMAAAGGSRPVVVAMNNISASGDAPLSFLMSSTAAVDSAGDYVYQAQAKAFVGGSEAVIDVFTWLENGASANYECHCAVSSGSLSSGTTGSWLSLSSSRTWSTNGSATLTVQLRDAHTSTVLDSCTVTLSVS